MITLIGLFVLVVLGSAACSLSEAAILSLPTMRARLLIEQKKSGARDLLYLKENIQLTIASIVIVNNAINIVGSIFIGQQVIHVFGDTALGVASAVLTFSIIVMGEVIPKSLGERYRGVVGLACAKPLRVLILIMHPVVNSLSAITRPFLGTDRGPKITEEEIRLMLKMGKDAGTVESDEEILCQRVFKLNDLRAFQIMKPLDQVFALPADTPLHQLRQAVIDCPYSRILVYDKDPRDFIGVVQHRVLLRELAQDNDTLTIRPLMAQPVFVNWFTRADELLQKFQMTNQHLFIVQDTHGKDVGIVTMEDVLEELFGEIYDEKDIPQKDRIVPA